MLSAIGSLIRSASISSKQSPTPSSKDSINSIHQLANVYNRQQRFDLVVKLYEDVLVVEKKNLGDENPEVLALKNGKIFSL